MAKKRKQVRFYELRKRDARDDLAPIDAEFWPKFRAHFRGVNALDLSVKHSQREYIGSVRTALRPAQEYILFGHKRDRSDYPMGVHPESGDWGTPTVQDGNGSPVHLVEPTYIVDVPGTTCVALLSTSRAANISALELWLDTITGLQTTGDRLELLPVLDPSTAQKLDQAVGATKVEVRVPRGVDPIALEGQGGAGPAIARAVQFTDEAMAVNIVWSAGRTDPPADLKVKMLDALRSVVGGQVAADKVRATLQLPHDDDPGELHKEEIDFIKQRVAFPVDFDVVPDQPFSEESALTGMLDAVARFRAEVL